MMILVTRPQPQADEWTLQLRALGEQAQALPLIAVGPPADASAVHAAWRDLPATRLVMFVSPNAALWFARQRPPQAPWPPHVLAAAPGPGTAQALRHALGGNGPGAAHLVTPPADSEQFDSEHLWPHLAGMAWQRQRVLIVSGGDQGEARGRQWLTERLSDAGAEVRTVLTYQRQCAAWDAAATALAQAAAARPAEHLWLLSSSEAVQHLDTLLNGVPAGACALATHPRVAETAAAAGFQTVRVARPTPEAVAQARRSWAPPPP